MNPEALRDLAIHVLEEMKGVEIATLDVRTLTNITDYMIVCTGRSTRHVKSLADEVAREAKQAQVKNTRIEGDSENEWVVVDLGDVVVHVMLAQARAFYNLEDLWEPIKTSREQESK